MVLGYVRVKDRAVFASTTVQPRRNNAVGLAKA
jgi:hypothetical protein